MKTHLYQAVLLAGAVVFGATTGRGQTLKANIPFPFRTSNAEMPAGEYSVTQTQAGGAVIVLSNQAARKSDMILVKNRMGGSDTSPRMVFQCSENRCALAEIWGATSGGGVQLWQPNRKARDLERLAVVYFERKPAGK